MEEQTDVEFEIGSYFKIYICLSMEFHNFLHSTVLSVIRVGKLNNSYLRQLVISVMTVVEYHSGAGEFQ